MAEITAALVKELRELTGVGMMDCKKALTETKGNIDDAVDWLRTKGLANAAKKSTNVTPEGIVAVHVEGSNGVVLEVNSQTDFVAKNELFQNFVKNIAKLALSVETVEELKALPYENGNTVEAELTNLISTIGENLNIRRFKKVISNGQLFSYVHNVISEGLGKIGVIVAFDNQGDAASIGRQIAMHISASNPKALNVESLDPEVVSREMKVQKDKILEEGKPAEIAEKMLTGRMNKFYQESCLLEQSFVVDPDKKVSQVLKEANTSVIDYAFYILGEGIEKKEEDFASEVAKVVAGQ